MKFAKSVRPIFVFQVTGKMYFYNAPKREREIEQGEIVERERERKYLEYFIYYVNPIPVALKHEVQNTYHHETCYF